MNQAYPSRSLFLSIILGGTLVAATVALSEALCPYSSAWAEAANSSMVENAQIQIHQVDAVLNGVATPDSGWGFAQLTYLGDPQVLYFNLARRDSWEIQNIPILSGRGIGRSHDEYMAFDLGVLHGEDVLQIEVGISLTPFPLDAPPLCDLFLPVGDMTIDMSSGIRRDTMTLGEPGPMIGGLTFNAATSNGTIKNQDCGKNECVPAAVSNSLQTLNERFRLGINADDITIAALKPALEWRAGGCDANRWPDLKKAYLEDKDIPVTTEEIAAPEGNQEAGRLVKRLMRERKRNCQIEMTVEGHCVLVTEIAPVENTNDYILTVQHDTKQGEEGGTIAQKVEYSPNTQTIKGGWMLDGKTVINFVIQCRERA